jgi:endonuclease G
MNFALEWDHSKKATRWVCWEMDGTNRQERYSRNKLWPNGDPWAYDPLVPQKEQQATYSELSNSYFPGYDPKLYKESDWLYQKGHICASQDRIYDKEANEQTFYMTNIMPMVGNFNGKLWSKLETQVRTWGKNSDTLYICKGGTINKDSLILDYTIGGHIVPKYFFMALLRTSSKGISAIGFWMEHRNEDRSNDKLSIYAKSIDQLESLTGIDFFCNVPDETEDKVEISFIKRAPGSADRS